MRTTTLTLTLTALLLALAGPARAQWTNDPYNGMVSVVTAPANQESPRICALSNGNTLIGWYDERTGVTQIYYQVLNPLGVPLLEINGRPLFEGGWVYGWGGPDLDGLVPDGQGGCIAVVIDNRNGYYDIYGQRFDSLGNRLWGPTGLPLVLWPEGNTVLKDVVTDGLGNGFIAWNKNLFPINELYVQKFDLQTGARLWGDLGVMDCGGIAGCDYDQIVADGQGGVIDVWKDNRPGGYTYHLYVQHLDANGNPLLTVNGIPVLDLFGQQLEVGALCDGASDGRGGGIWAYAPFGASSLLLFRLNGQGRTLWLWMSPYYGSHAFYDMKRHSAYNTVWLSDYENRPGAAAVYLYQFDIQGHALFGSWGLPYGGDRMSQTSDGMMTFDGSFVAQHTRLYARRVNFRGRLAWTSSVALGGATPGGGPIFASIVGAPDGTDGAVVAFEDRRNQTTTPDISAQRVQWNGRLGNPPPLPEAAPAAAPQMTVLGSGQVQFVLPQAGQIKLELFDLLGRRVALLREGFEPAGMQTIALDNSHLPSGIYLLRLSTPAGTQMAKLLIVH